MATFWKEPLASGETPEELLETLYYEGRTDEQIASLVSVMTGRRVSVTAACKKRQALGLSKTRSGIPLIKASTAPRYDKIPHVDGDALVMCDLHVPFHDAPWCNRCISLALLWGVPNLILAGDILDMFALKSFFPFFLADEDGRQKRPDLEDELADAGQIFDALAAFERVLYISGGHELRYLRKLESPIAVSRFARLFTDLPQLETSPYHKCKVGDDWHVSHPKNSNVIPARVPTFLIRKHRENVAIGHDHVWGLAQDESGRNVAVSIGICADPKRLDYVALQDTTRPEVAQGALIIKRNKPWLLSPKWTDWRALRAIDWGKV